MDLKEDQEKEEVPLEIQDENAYGNPEIDPYFSDETQKENLYQEAEYENPEVYYDS